MRPIGPVALRRAAEFARRRNVERRVAATPQPFLAPVVAAIIADEDEAHEIETPGFISRTIAKLTGEKA
jgi:hypothetical protein